MMVCVIVFFFIKQKTAYERRISDWSSDVCSSDLTLAVAAGSVDLGDRVVLVVHDWGSVLGFDWARRHRERVQGIAYMEAVTMPLEWADFPEQDRSAERRVGKECVSTCRSRWAPDH